MNVVITGASTGIGYEAVRSLSKDNHVVIAIARSKDKLLQLKQDCVSINKDAKVFVYAHDITTIEANDIKSYLEEIKISHIDVLINNAGNLINKPFLELNDKDWQEVYSVNVFSAARMIKHFYSYLKKSSQPHIVNITSMGGINGTSKFAGLAAYSSSKGAVGILTECLAEEFKSDNIKVNALALGSVQTEMFSKAFPDFKAPLTSLQMGEYVAWFAVNGNKFFNGKILPVALSTP